MVKIVVATHGELGKAILESGNMLFPVENDVVAVGLYPEMNPEDFGKELEIACEVPDGYSGVLVFADILGGTPFNQSLILSCERSDMRVVPGINLPMLLEAFINREAMDFDALVAAVISAGKEGIQEAKLN